MTPLSIRETSAARLGRVPSPRPCGISVPAGTGMAVVVVPADEVELDSAGRVVVEPLGAGLVTAVVSGLVTGGLLFAVALWMLPALAGRGSSLKALAGTVRPGGRRRKGAERGSLPIVTGDAGDRTPACRRYVVQARSTHPGGDCHSRRD
jgi:hypothetical protein